MSSQKKCNLCKQPLPFSERNGLKTYKQKQGIGIDCGCFYDWQKSNKPKPIPKRSMKRKTQELVYKELRRVFLSKKENQVCPITNEKATTIHHKKGRIGDLLNDTRYWIALSMKGHEYVENNPEWAKQNGYSLNRLSND